MRQAVKKLKVVARREPAPVAGALLAPNVSRVSRILGLREGSWLVECGPAGELHVARTLLALSPTEMRAAAEAKREALIVFEDGVPERPIVVGLLAGSPAEPLQRVEAKLDGKRVVLEAADEIVLRCGEASITLRSNGRVVVRGTYVETRSKGVNRIKGGSVQIN